MKKLGILAGLAAIATIGTAFASFSWEFDSTEFAVSPTEDNYVTIDMGMFFLDTQSYYVANNSDDEPCIGVSLSTEVTEVDVVKDETLVDEEYVSGLRLSMDDPINVLIDPTDYTAFYIKEGTDINDSDNLIPMEITDITIKFNAGFRNSEEYNPEADPFYVSDGILKVDLSDSPIELDGEYQDENFKYPIAIFGIEEGEYGVYTNIYHSYVTDLTTANFEFLNDGAEDFYMSIEAAQLTVRYGAGDGDTTTIGGLDL